jgi:esterase/lipase superfamily enzyme
VFRALIVALAVPLCGCVADGLDALHARPSDFKALAARVNEQPRRVPIFVASTRRDDGGGDAEGRAHFSLTVIGTPPGHRTGSIERSTLDANDGRRFFSVLSSRNLGEEELSAEMAAHLAGRAGAARDVLLFVHGYDTGLDDARYRMAQLVVDARFAGVAALFAWDSAGRSGLSAYEGDKEGATASRDALEKLLLDLARVPGVGRIHVLAHSMGAWLAMESLRTIAASGRPDLDGRLGEVMLAAPDIDLAVFRQQAARLGPGRITIFVASNDRALRLSSRVAGDRPRLGAIDPQNPGDREILEELGVAAHDISRFSTDFEGHDTFAQAPAVVRQIGAELAAPEPEKASDRADPSPEVMAAASTGGE